MHDPEESFEKNNTDLINRVLPGISAEKLKRMSMRTRSSRP